MPKAYYYLAAAIVGTIIGLGFGYSIFALSWRGFHVSFVEWLTGTGWGSQRFFTDAVIWAIMGAVLSAAAVFIVKR